MRQLPRRRADIHSPLRLQVCVETMMHLTCTNMPESQLETALDKVRQRRIQACMWHADVPSDASRACMQVKSYGIQSFTVVEGGFSCALDLVKYIRYWCHPMVLWSYCV